MELFFTGRCIESYCALRGNISTDFKSRNFIGYMFLDHNPIKMEISNVKVNIKNFNDVEITEYISIRFLVQGGK